MSGNEGHTSDYRFILGETHNVACYLAIAIVLGGTPGTLFICILEPTATGVSVLINIVLVILFFLVVRHTKRDKA